MTNLITKTAIAAVVALTAMGATSQANAGSVDVDVRIKTPHVVVRKPIVVHRPVVVVKPAPVVIYRAGRCTQNQALKKAMRKGLNKVYVSHVGAKRITVTGKVRGTWAKISFANVRGCPNV